jgi:hypothetical protein
VDGVDGVPGVEGVEGFVVVEGVDVVGGAVVVGVVGSVPPLPANTTAGTARRAAAPSVAPPVTNRRVVRCMRNPFLFDALPIQRGRPT